MSELVRVEITDQHGTVAEFADLTTLRQLSPRKRGQLEALMASSACDMAAATGLDEERALNALTGALVRHMADEKAYERVCQQKRLLPL